MFSQDMRIDFAFDNAYFDLAVVPFRIPYPVPFRLLGDETKVVWARCVLGSPQSVASTGMD